MTFISYAQNFEDVMLWRALKHISGGFYIDVGANDPSIDSVTRAFYERGWHGINIEPLSSHSADLQAQRERDINLQCAAGAESGELALWECDVRGWATASQEVIAQHTANGNEGRFQKVTVRRLAEICEEFVSGDIHFLKIDVEGFEVSVIRGMDFSRFRPWILIIEATKPNSTTEANDEWESLVLGAGYLLAYCDGLNRFYVADEHLELLPAFKYPPNVFDNFLLIRQQQIEARATQAEATATQAEARATQAEARATQAEASATQAETRAIQAEARATQAAAFVNTLLNSTSWRITAPLRWVGRMARHLSPGALKPTVKILLQHAALYIGRRPWLKRLVLTGMSSFPGLKTRLTGVVWATTAAKWNQPRAELADIAQLTPRARQVYADLKAAIARHKEEG